MPNSFTNTAAHEICSFGNKITASFTTERDHKKTKQEDSKTLLCVHSDVTTGSPGNVNCRGKQ